MTGSFAEKGLTKRQNCETNSKKSLTMQQIPNNIPGCYYNKAIVDFAEALTSEKICRKELQWLLLS
jgi:hypothetical protein